MQIANECNRRAALDDSVKLPVKPFVVTMVLALAGFSALYLGLELGLWLWLYKGIGGDFNPWALPAGLAAVSLSWVPVLLIKTFYRRAGK